MFFAATSDFSATSASLFPSVFCQKFLLNFYRLVDIKPEPSTIAHVQFAFAHFVEPAVGLGSSLDLGQLAEQRALKSRTGGMVGELRKLSLVQLLLHNAGVSLYGHRGSSTGAGQLGLCKNGVFKRLFDRNFYSMAKKHARCAKCACAADATSEMQVRSTPATAPQMVPRRYWGRRTCRTARKRRCLCRFQLQATKIPQTAPFYLRTCLQGF